MKRTYQITLFILIGILTGLSNAKAQLYEISLDEKIQHSSLIVEGRVVAQESYKAPNGEVYTANKVAVSALLKGKLKENFITITTWGGETEDETVTWSHMLTLFPGEVGIFFLERNKVPETGNRDFPSPAYEVYSSSQGFLKFARNDIGALVAYEPFHTYTNLKDEVYDCVAGKTGQQRMIVDVSESMLRRSGIRYFFKTLSVSGTTVNFEILVNSLYDNRLLHKAGAAVNYNPDCFGSNIATNGSLSLQSNGISSNTVYSLTKSNLTSSKAKIELSTTGSTTSLSTLTTSEQTLAKASLTIQNPFADPEISFDIAEMYALSKFWESGASYEFDTVIVETDFNFGHFAPKIDSIRPLSLRAGTSDTLRIYGSGFGNIQGSSQVFFSDASVGINQNNRVRPLPDDYVFWSENLIRVIVPTVGYNSDTLTTSYYAGSGPVWVKVGSSTEKSSESLKVRLAAINRSRNDGGTVPKRKAAHLVGDFGEYQGYTLYYTTDFKAKAGAVDAFERALCSWIEKDSINFRIKEQSAIDPIYLQYACSIAMVDNLPGGVSSSTKAVTTRTYIDLCSSGGVVLYTVVRKFDINFRKSTNWYTDEFIDINNNWETKPDLQAYALHELGHAQLLLHVNQMNDVMWWEIFGAKRTLQSGEIEGGQYIQKISRSNGPSGCSSGIAILTDCGLINDLDGVLPEYSISVSPNPTSGFLTVSSSTLGQKQQINLFDNLGQRIFSTSSNEKEIRVDLATYPSGIYILTVLEENGITQTFKIVKQ